MSPEFERVTAAEAGQRLRRAPGTIHCWGSRYDARKIKLGGRVYYDFGDLYVIEREVHHQHPVPATWQERAQMRERCPHALPVQLNAHVA
jgi:hypothetical protein